MKILVTAFDPFGGESVNPAQLTLEGLPEQLGAYQIVKLVVPTVFGVSGDLVTAAMDRERPDAVVCLGQAGGRDAVTPERVAINVMDAVRPDNVGVIPRDEPVVPGGPAAWFSTLPIKAMAEAVKNAGLPAKVSNTAGTFVCNHLFYRVRHHAERAMPHCRCGFIHVPYIPEQTADKPDKFAMPLAEIIRAITACLEQL